MGGQALHVIVYGFLRCLLELSFQDAILITENHSLFARHSVGEDAYITKIENVLELDSPRGRN